MDGHLQRGFRAGREAPKTHVFGGKDSSGCEKSIRSLRSTPSLRGSFRKHKWRLGK